MSGVLFREDEKMSRIPPGIWDHLEANRPKGENLTAKVAFPDLTPRLFFALDAEKIHHILVLLDPEDPDYFDRQSRGIFIRTHELTVHGQAPARYLDLICREGSGHAGFDLIGTEIATELTKGIMPPVDIVRQVMARWRRFWGQTPQDLLTRNEVIGLIAEIRFLSGWLFTIFGAAESVRRWRGPFGSRHDFEWKGSSVEVKATTSTRGRIFHINGIDQLDNPENGDLFFFGVRLRALPT